MLAVRNRTKLIVGIDYGTTYSGLSFALSNAADFKDIHPWTKYPGSATHIAEHSHKAPSWVAFKDENPDLDENAWGYQIEPGMKTYAWTKLLLDDQALATEYDDPDLNKAVGNGLMRLPAGRTAKDVVTEYLKGMHSMYKKAVIEKIGADILEEMPVDFWLTVPATWTERAKLITRAAALDAGFASRPIDRLSLITEPDAAAHMALKSSIHHVEDLIDVGTGVMVCDLGGGTVVSSTPLKTLYLAKKAEDITTSEIIRKTPSLKLREIAIGAGGKCGGTFVDRNLYKLLSERFGTAFTGLGPQHVGPGSQFMDQFEMRKRDFSLDTPSKKSYRLTLPMHSLKVTPEMQKYYDPHFYWVLLSKDDMKSLFDPVIDVILRLLKDQVDQVKRDKEPIIKTMCLVGGFGSSPYVKEKLLEWCSEQEIRLTTPWTGAWAAVVCGAVLRGVEGSMFRQKKCRRHYGHSISRTYDPAVHFNFDENKRRLWNDPWTKEQNLSGFMDWEIAKGALLDDDTEISTSFYSHFSEYFDGKHTHDLYSCSLDEAPETIENERIEKVGEVLYTIDDIGIDKTKIKSIQDANGIHWYQLLLTLTIRLSDDDVGVLTIPYKSGPDGDIVLDVVYPEEADDSPTTVLIHIHGGFLIVGDRYSFAPYWLVNAATSRKWIFVSPDYRLVPESTAHVSLDDSIDAYNWVRSSLADALGRPIGPVLLAGSSAGGYLALTTANAVEQKPDALLLIYGMLDAAGPRYTTPGTNIWGAPPFDTASVLSQFPRTKQNDDRKAISGYPPSENFQQDPRFQVASALHIDALFPDYMTGVEGLSREIASKGIDAIPEEHRRLFPLSFGDLGKIPRTFLLHGVNDSAVTVDCSIVAEKKLREAGVEVEKDFPEDAEHGFDGRIGNVDVEKKEADGIPNVESLRNAVRFLDSSSKK
ncbi:hsp70 [Fusarium circinatum]|uniref:Hsp70 n=1 Tax=Fusarium circinatum TaxID=48490 RepID=A0A8H5WSG3_FUSCI|nr:hsp70 [Fusarium circinatum]